MATTVSTTGSVTNITVQTGTQNLFSNVAADTGTVVVDSTTDVLTIAGGEGIDTTGTAGTDTITIAGEDASTSNKGIASFSSSNFDVSSGAVSLKANGINDTHLDFGTGTNQINTDDLTEGSTNLYFTNARADARITAAGIFDGSTNLVMTDGVSLLTPDSTAGITFQTSGSTFGTGVDSIQIGKTEAQDTILPTSTGIDLGSTTKRFDVFSANINVSGTVTGIDTDDVSEGSSNQYFTNARADARIAAATIDADTTTIQNLEVDNLKSGVLDTDISAVSGSDDTLASAKAIKTYVDSQILTKDNTDEITEGSSNLYFTNARADARITNNILDEDNFASDSATNTASQQSIKAYIATQIATKDNSDEITEGSTNLYFTNARARAAISASGSIGYNSSTGALTYTQAAIDADSVTISNLELDNLKSGVLDTDISAVSASDDTIASAKAIKTYVDAQIATKDALSELSGDTDDVSEGSSNLYFTNARAEAVSINNVVEDTTPQLGGSLDVNGNKIVSTSGGDIDIEPNGTGDVLLGNFKFDADQTVGASQDNFVLTYDNSSGKISLEASAGGGGSLSNVVEDTSPQLGGDLDVNGQKIISSATNQNIVLEPNGSGDVLFNKHGRFIDDKYMHFGTEFDAYIGFDSGGKRLVFESRDYGTNTSGKGDIRIRADNKVELIAGRDQDANGDLQLRAFDEFQFRKGTAFAKCASDVQATTNGTTSVTLNRALTQGELNAFEHNDTGDALYFYDNSSFSNSNRRNMDNYIQVTGKGSGSTPTLTLASAISNLPDGTHTGRHLMFESSAVVVNVDGSRGNLDDGAQFVLENRIGEEGPQDRSLIFRAKDFHDGGGYFEPGSGVSDGAEHCPVIYDLGIKADENTLTLTHSTMIDDSETTQEVFKARGRASNTSTIGSETAPEVFQFSINPQVPSKTKAQLDAISNPQTGEIAMCSNGAAGSPCLALYGGSSWINVSGAALSTS